MYNVEVRSDMAEYFAKNVRIETRPTETYCAVDDVFGNRYVDVEGNSYIRGFLEFSEREDRHWTGGHNFLDAWRGMFEQRTGQKFDLGEFKGCLPLEISVEQDTFHDCTTIKMEFSIDHIDQYSNRLDEMRLPFELGSIRPKGKKLEKMKAEHFDKDLFKL